MPHLMMSSKSLVYLKFFVLGALLVAGANYVWADWSDPPSGDPPHSCDPGGAGQLPIGCPELPINVGIGAQTKAGPLVLAGSLNLTNSSAKMVINGPLGIGANFCVGGEPPGCIEFDGQAVLDIAGQLRIRGGTPGPGKVLIAASPDGINADGTVAWGDPPFTGISQLAAGPGITFSQFATGNPPGTKVTTLPNTGNPNGHISIFNGEVQRRIAEDCITTPGGNNYSGLIEIRSDGTIVCRNFIIDVNAGSGLDGLVTNGVATLNVDVGDGLIVDGSSKLTINVGATGDGLAAGPTGLTFESCTGSNKTWKWVDATTKWTCADFPGASGSATALPGESVMYLKRKNSGLGFGDPAACPDTNWSASALYNENVGHASNFNRVRACYRADVSCQSFRLTATSTGTLGNCPGSSWATTTGALTCGSGPCSREFAPGGTLDHYVRTCYLCN